MTLFRILYWWAVLGIIPYIFLVIDVIINMDSLSTPKYWLLTIICGPAAVVAYFIILLQLRAIKATKGAPSGSKEEV